jgi:photosystem I P700 chlorophyll a apoprotein A2
VEPFQDAWGTFLSAKWYLYGKFIDAPAHIAGSSLGAGRASLTFLGGLEPITGSLFIGDQAHHHLAIGLVFLLLAEVHFLTPLSACALRAGSPVNTNGNHAGSESSGRVSSGPAFRLGTESVAEAGAGLAVLTSAVAQHIYSMTPYYYLSYDYCASVALYVHHQYISAFLIMILPPHLAISLTREEVIATCKVRDGDRSRLNFASAQSSQRYLTKFTQIEVILEHKAQLISHLSWLCLWLGFHTLGVFVYNDTCFAFGRGLDSILIEPCRSLELGPGDWESHHAIALGLHTSLLIALKGSLDGPGSRMMPDKGAMPYSFACDGPGRGGTCDISAWDSFYLAMFWVLNTLAWITFYFHYKHLTLWSRGALQFGLSSTYLNGWFRDYLWFNSASLIDGYNALGANDLSASAFGFLAAHFSWATGFMFLIAWRGYWQECVDVILYMHLKTPILYDLWSAAYYTPLALSIVQARLIGLSHFSVGFILTYATFVLGATS